MEQVAVGEAWPEQVAAHKSPEAVELRQEGQSLQSERAAGSRVAGNWAAQVVARRLAGRVAPHVPDALAG